MADINARVRSIIGSTAEWAANNIVIGDGEIALERTTTGVKVKVGDGVKTFGALSYIKVDSASVTTSAPATGSAPATPVAGMLVPISSAGTLGASWGNLSGQKVTAQDVVIRLADGTWRIIGGSQSATLSAISASAGAADAGKLVKTDAKGIIDSSLMPSTAVSGTASAGLVPKLDANGKIPAALINLPGAMLFKGTKDVTAAMGTITGLAQGWFYITAKAGTVDASWTGIGGETVGAGDAVIYDGTNFHVLESETSVVGAYVRADGTQAMTGNLTLPSQAAAADAIPTAKQAATVGLIEALSSAAVFSPTATYAQGGFVSYGGVIYKAKAAVTPAAWDVTQWDRVAGLKNINAANNSVLYVDANGNIVGDSGLVRDSSGNLGLGAAPSDWNPNSRAFEIGGSTVTSLALNSTGAIGEIFFNAYRNIGGSSSYKTSSYAGYMSFNNRVAGGWEWQLAPSGTAGSDVTFTTAMVLDKDGRLGVGVAPSDVWPAIASSSGANGATISKGLIACSKNNATFLFDRNDGDGTMGTFYRTGTEVGSISVTSSATSYNTSSDYRLKNVTGPITNSGAYIDSLNPCEGTFKIDGSPFVGLIAHEVQAVSRTKIVNGEKDGETMQSMSYAAAEIIANLIAEVKSLRTRIAALEAK